MTLRYSTGLRNFLGKYGGLAQALQQGQLELRTGSQPASADAAPTGTLLCVITDNAQARTAEVSATGTLTLTGGAAGSQDTVTVNGVNILGASVPFNSTLNQTATDIASQINRNNSSPKYMASASGAVVTIKALPGVGASANGFVVSGTSTTLTQTYANMAGGVTAVNGLKFDQIVAADMQKYPNQVWAGVNQSPGGVAGWFRFVGAVADSGALDSSGTAIRLDGSISTSGADMNLNNTNLAATATTTIGTADTQVPGQ